MQEKAQVGKFAVVGVINTLIDYVILNLLVFFGFTTALMVLGQEFLVANIISVFIAMINSFVLNKQWTFRGESGNVYLQILKFFVVTVIGMFVIHQVIFNLFYVNGGITGLFSFVSLFVVAIVHTLRLDVIFSDQFIILNFAKSIAIIASLVWNFIGYKFVVFKK